MNVVRRVGLLLSFFLPSFLPGCASQANTHDEDARRIDALQAENAELKEEVEHLRETLVQIITCNFGPSCPSYPPIDAVILDVNRDLKSVELDKGTHDGVEPGYVFSVYLGAMYKGQVRIVTVQEATSSGLILSEKNAIAAGDSASTQL